jgi:hypothetical protein
MDVVKSDIEKKSGQYIDISREYDAYSPQEKITHHKDVVNKLHQLKSSMDFENKKLAELKAKFMEEFDGAMGRIGVINGQIDTYVDTIKTGVYQDIMTSVEGLKNVIKPKAFKDLVQGIGDNINVPVSWADMENDKDIPIFTISPPPVRAHPPASTPVNWASIAKNAPGVSSSSSSSSTAISHQPAVIHSHSHSQKTGIVQANIIIDDISVKAISVKSIDAARTHPGELCYIYALSEFALSTSYGTFHGKIDDYIPSSHKGKYKTVYCRNGHRHPQYAACTFVHNSYFSGEKEEYYMANNLLANTVPVESTLGAYMDNLHASINEGGSRRHSGGQQDTSTELYQLGRLMIHMAIVSSIVSAKYGSDYMNVAKY